MLSKNQKLHYDYLGNDETKEYYGLFNNPKKGYKIDSKRMKKTLKFELNNNIIKKMENRNTKYFYPKYYKYNDYAINIFRGAILDLENDWKKEFKPLMINIKTPKDTSDKAYTSDLYMSGIIERDEVNVMAMHEGIKRERKYLYVINSFYAQYIHQIASTLEGVLINVLNKKNIKVEKFCRNNLFKIYLGKTKKEMKSMEFYNTYDKLYSLWNFLKHNNKSTFETVKKRFPELLYKNECEYLERNGFLAINYLKLNDELIENLLEDLILFFEEFCLLFFQEDIEESHWNYSMWFYHLVRNKIDDIINPLGLPWYL